MAEQRTTSTDKVALAKQKIERYWTSLNRQNYFQIFGADPDSDPEKIKVAYKALAKLWHADAYAGMDLGDDAQTMLDAIFKRITEAYDTITDPKTRTEYLVLIQRQAKGLSTDVNAVLQAEQLFDDALLKVRRKDWKGAKTALEDAMKLNPDDPLMPVHHAWAHYQCSANKKAVAVEVVESLKKAVKKHENLPLAYQYMGEICFQIDKPLEAKKAWRLCLEWEPGNVEATRGIRLVNQRELQAKNSGLGGFVKKLFGK